MIKIKIKKKINEAGLKVVTPERYAQLLAMSKKMGQSEEEFKKLFTTQQPKEKVSSLDPKKAIGNLNIDNVVEWNTLSEDERNFIKTKLTFGKNSGFNAMLSQDVPLFIIVARKNNIPVGWVGFFDETTENNKKFATMMAFISENERKTKLASQLVAKLLQQKPYKNILAIPKDDKISKFFESLIPVLKLGGVKNYRIMKTSDILNTEIAFEDKFWNKKYLTSGYNFMDVKGF